MLVADPEISCLDQRHLHNWWRLALPPGISRETRYALLILEGGIPIHAIRSGEGAIEVPAFGGSSKAQLAALSRELDVEGLLVLERSALGALIDNIQRSLSHADDYPRQGISMWQALKKAEGIWSHPPLLELIPPLRAAPLQKTFDLLVPNNSALLAYVMEDRRVHCSGIAVKRQGAIEAAYMQPVIGDLVTEREIARDWRQNYGRVNRAVESRLARPCISVFTERAAVERILRGPAEQVATELRERNLIIDPAPAWLQGLIGGAAVAAAASRSAKRMARFLPKGARKMAGDLAGVAQERINNSSANPFAALGFDPIELLQALRGFYSTR